MTSGCPLLWRCTTLRPTGRRRWPFTAWCWSSSSLEPFGRPGWEPLGGGLAGWSIRTSAQLSNLTLVAGNFLEIAMTSLLYLSMQASRPWEAFWLFFLWAAMWSAASDRSIRPASLSSPEAMSKSNLPTCSQVMFPCWVETWVRASMTNLPMVPDCWLDMKCILSSVSWQNWQSWELAILNLCSCFPFGSRGGRCLFFFNDAMFSNS